MGGRTGNYSTEISEAWAVIKKLERYRPLIGKSGKKGWRAVFYKTKSPLSSIFYDATTAPLAICQAALLLKGHTGTIMSIDDVIEEEGKKLEEFLTTD